MNQMNGKTLIKAERQRQIEVEGWEQRHDDVQGSEALEYAALCYRDADENSELPTQWPWDRKWWKPKSRHRNLVRSGALYQAAADTAERAGEYQRRDDLLAQVNTCAILIDGINRFEEKEGKTGVDPFNEFNSAVLELIQSVAGRKLNSKVLYAIVRNKPALNALLYYWREQCNDSKKLAIDKLIKHNKDHFQSITACLVRDLFMHSENDGGELTDNELAILNQHDSQRTGA